MLQRFTHSPNSVEAHGESYYLSVLHCIITSRGWYKTGCWRSREFEVRHCDIKRRSNLWSRHSDVRRNTTGSKCSNSSVAQTSSEVIRILGMGLMFSFKRKGSHHSHFLIFEENITAVICLVMSVNKRRLNESRL